MVSTTKRPYFLGSVILKQEETSSNKDSILTVIDGQQRLTTLAGLHQCTTLKRL